MALTKALNYYVDDDGYYRRIPFDVVSLDGVVVGVAPVGVKNDDVLEYDSDGFISCHLDFFDPSEGGDANKKAGEINELSEQTDEKTFIAEYENVIGFYESDSSQTYEFDFDKPEYKE